MRSSLFFFIVLSLLALAFTNPRGCCGFGFNDWKQDISEEQVQNTTGKGFLTYYDLVKRGEAAGEWWWWTPKKDGPRKPDH